MISLKARYPVEVHFFSAFLMKKKASWAYPYCRIPTSDFNTSLNSNLLFYFYQLKVFYINWILKTDLSHTNDVETHWPRHEVREQLVDSRTSENRFKVLCRVHTKCFAQCCPLGQFINQTNEIANAAQHVTTNDSHPLWVGKIVWF